jgi:hypothetical protein
MMLLRVEAAIVLSLLPLACSRPAEDQAAQRSDTVATDAVAPFDWQKRIGMFNVKGDTTCMRIASDALPVGDTVTLVMMGDSQRLERSVVRERVSLCSVPTESSYGYSYYLLQPSPAGGYGIAIAGAFTPQSSAGVVRVDLDGDGVPESFRQCPSSEGQHLTVWTGDPLVGKRRSHAYYYVGYDMVFACDPRDYEEVK